MCQQSTDFSYFPRGNRTSISSRGHNTMVNKLDLHFEMKKMLRVKTAILCRSPGDSLLDIVASDREAFSGIRVLFASDEGGVPLQGLGRSDNPNVPVVPLFAGKGIFAFSDAIEKQMRSGSAPLEFPFFSLLDTNFLTELPGFFRHENSKHREKVRATLQFIEDQGGRGFDWMFASLENLREVVKPNNPWPYQKVAAAKMFDAMMHAPEVRERVLKGHAEQIQDYISAAEEMWDSFLTNRDVWACIQRRDMMQSIMLRALLECWNGRSVDDGIRCLVDFCLDNFDAMPLKELYFGWKALSGFADKQTRMPIFDEPALRNPNADSANRISALAWDLYMFRHCETLMTERKGNQFIIPVVTTLDDGLLKAIKSCPLRALLIHDEARKVEAIFDDEIEFSTCLDRALSNETKMRINDPVRIARPKRISKHDLSYLINSLESEVKKAAKARA
ncbi:hypothetical protein KHW15_12715 [Pseudomonas syringae]|uniref:hypothetical protein n=2 Tax=Pseudomonas syringae TaxID=317 RepID=UPI001BD12179|nr:hypothetical protein [Pseudomonas syringae]MBS7420382.1 hypothetical protein [Pseudomonas syringae]MBS7431999.1 hypothetical protein [Pseudomonas syringae]QVI68308.1 hypothetical protein KHW12_14050 [Pseudomonas syringae]QVI82866.1 hypothetical protein KHW15_12715 [Pseudomonas syringae]